MINKKKDLRNYLEKEELIQLADFELELQRTNSETKFNLLKQIIEYYYQIAELRKLIEEEKNDTWYLSRSTNPSW